MVITDGVWFELPPFDGDLRLRHNVPSREARRTGRLSCAEYASPGEKIQKAFAATSENHRTANAECLKVGLGSNVTWNAEKSVMPAACISNKQSYLRHHR